LLLDFAAMDGAAPNRCAGNDVEEGNVALEDSQSLPQGSVRGASSDAYAFVLSPPCTVHESFQSRRHARLAAVGTAAALLICAVIAGSWDQNVKVRVSLDTELQGATLPGYSPAALALSSHENNVAKILQRERARQTAPPKASDDDKPSLSTKALKKIMAAARAAAQKNNAMIRDADDELRASQKELGGNAASVDLLTGGSSSGGGGGGADISSGGGDSGTNLADLIDMARKDKMAAPALKAATAAAARNKQLMAQAGQELRDSQRVLGKAAIGLPSLGKPLNPSSLERIAADARKGEAGGKGSGVGAEGSGMASARLERKFIAATKLAREMP